MHEDLFFKGIIGVCFRIIPYVRKHRMVRGACFWALATCTQERPALSYWMLTGRVLDQFGSVPIDRNFWHTGLWQSWSPDGRYVYYQSGEAYDRPAVTRRELKTGCEVRLEGADMEGAPTGDAPVTSGLLGMLYAAGYGDTHFHPDRAPVPFEQRDKHGLFTYDFDARTSRLALSVAQIREIVGDPQLDTWGSRAAPKDRRRYYAYGVLPALESGRETVYVSLWQPLRGQTARRT